MIILFKFFTCHDFIKLYPFDLWTLLQKSAFVKMFFWPTYVQWEQMKIMETLFKNWRLSFLSFVVEKYLEPVAIIRLAYPRSGLGRQKLYAILGQEMTFKKKPCSRR